MKLNILHIITTIERGGAENQLLILVRNQLALGNNVSVRYLKGNPDLLKAFENLGVKIYHPTRYFFLDCLELRKVLSQKFDVVHAHLPRAELQLAIFSKFFRIKSTLVATRHNAESFFPKAPKFASGWLSRFCLKAFKGIIFISVAVEQFVLNEKEVPANIPSEVIYYGYDDIIPPTLDKNLTRPVENRPFLFVGRLTKQKNLPVLLGAFREYLTQNPNSELHIYGTGELEHNLRLTVLDLTTNIHWKGKTSNLQRLMNSYKCLILPSYYEGFGLVLLEAMNAKIPVLASNTSAIPEVLGSDNPGLFSPYDKTSLVTLLKLMDDKDFRKNLLEIQSARLKLFHPKNMTHRIQKFYISLIH